MIQFVQREPIPSGSALVVLAQDLNQLTGAGFRTEEIDYVRKQQELKHQCIMVPRLEAPVFVLFVPADKSLEARQEAVRRRAVAVQEGVNQRKSTVLSVVDCTADPLNVYAFLEGLILSDYQFIKYRSDKKDQIHTLSEVFLMGDILPSGLLEQLISLSRAVYWVRDLVNEPSSYLSAARMADHFVQMGGESGFSIEVLGKEKIEALKMGGLLSVNSGSIEPPRFSILTWKPENARNEKPIVLVGKGLVFDTGGLCLKPPASMDEMKSDMSGGAAVAGTLYALARTKSPVYVIGLVPSTDNRLSASAFTPGDIITMYDGTTVEMINSDAEGRMILADALAYAKQFDPQLVVDIATLTGSATVAIGDIGIVAMGNASREWMESLKLSGDNTYERIAEFPFWDEYKELIESKIADLKNSGKRHAGAITAGKFLEHFTDYPYIHLDIAGPAYLEKADGYRMQGGTGVGVRLLFDFIHRII